jgi:hypothetical protein
MVKRQSVGVTDIAVVLAGGDFVDERAPPSFSTM